MTGGGNRLVGVLLRHAASVMPAVRSEWITAMRAEAELVPADERLAFAWGCLWSSYCERLTDASTILAAGRWSIGLGLAAASAICVRTAYMLRHESAFTLILILGLICIAATLAFLRFGLKPLPQIALAGLAGGLIAMLLAGDPAAVSGAAGFSSRFYQAILLEQVVCWATLLAVAHLLLALEKRQGAR